MTTTERKVNPPCQVCGVETDVCSDHSGGWLECPACRNVQDLELTPGGPVGRWTPVDADLAHDLAVLLGRWLSNTEGGNGPWLVYADGRLLYADGRLPGTRNGDSHR